MATLGSLVLELSANVGRLQTDMQKAVSIVDRGAAGMKRAASLAASALAGLGAGLIGGLSVGAFSSAIKSAIDYGDKLNDLSKSTGASVEALSFLDYAAKQSGTSIDGLSSAIAIMQKNLAKVAAGGARDAGKAFQTLGIDAKSLASEDLVTQLGTIGDALNKIQNPAQRAQLAAATVGKGFKDLLPLIAGGSAELETMAGRFVQLGGVITKEQAEKFGKLNDSIGDLQQSARGAAVAIGDKLAPALTDLFNALAKGIAPDDFGEQLQARADEIREQINTIEAQLRSGTLDPNDRSFLIPDIKLSPQAKDRFKKTLAELQQEMATVLSTLNDFRQRGRDTVSGGDSAPLADLGPTDEETKALEKIAQFQDNYLDGLRKQIVLQANGTELAKVQAEIAADASGRFDAQTTKDAIALATQIDLLKEAKDVREASAKLEKERIDLEAKASADLAKKKQDTIDALMTPLEKYIARVKELIALDIGADNLQRGIRGAREEMETAQTKASALVGAAKDLGLTFTSAFEDAVLGASKFSDVLKGLAQDIARLLIRKSVTEPLFNLLGNSLGSAFGGASGGGGGFSNFGALFPNARGGLYEVGGGAGEHPVAFSARAGEVVAVGTGMSGGGAPVINIYEAPPNTRAQMNPNGRDVDVFVGGSLAKNIASGRGGQLGLRPPLALR